MSIRLLRSRAPNHIQAPSDPGHTYTWAAWLYWEDLHPGWGTDWTNLSCRSSDASDDTPEIERDTDNQVGRLVYWHNAGSGTPGTTGAIRPGVWTHIAVTRPGASGTSTIWVNGKAAATNTVDAHTAANIAWGGYSLAGSDNMSGRMAHLRLWTAALSEAEIIAEMKSATVVKTASLWGDWPLLDDANDDSGNGRNLTVTGTAEYVAQPTMGAIQWIGTSTWSTTAGSSVSFAMPQGAAVGDLLVVFFNAEQASTGRSVSSWGQDNGNWNSIVNQFSSGQAVQGMVFWNTIDGSAINATQSITATLSASDEYSGVMMVFRNVDLTTPFTSVTSAGPGTSGDAVADAKSSLNAAQWVLFGAASAYGTTWTPPTDWTEIADHRSGTGTNNTSLAVCFRTGGTSTGADTYNAATTDYWIEWTAVLNPAVSTKNLTANSAGVSSTADALLPVTRSIAGNAAGVTSTPAALLPVTRPVAAAAAGSSATQDAALAFIVSFAANSAGTSSATDALVNVLRPIVAAATGVSSTTDALLPVTRSVTAVSTGASSTTDALLAILRSIAANSTGTVFAGNSDALIAVLRALVASATGVSALADAALDVAAGGTEWNLAAAADGNSTTNVALVSILRRLSAASASASSSSDGALAILWALAANAAGQSATTDALLPVVRALSGTAGGVSSTADATLSIAGLVSLLAHAAGVSLTTDAALAVARSIVAAAAGTSTTSDGALAILRALVASAPGASAATDALIAVLRKIAANGAGISATTDAALSIAGIISLLASAAGVSATTDAILSRALVVAAAAAGISDATDGALAILRNLQAQALGESVTVDALLPVERSILAGAQGQSATSDGDIVMQLVVGLLQIAVTLGGQGIHATGAGPGMAAVVTSPGVVAAGHAPDAAGSGTAPSIGGTGKR